MPEDDHEEEQPTQQERRNLREQLVDMDRRLARETSPVRLAKVLVALGVLASIVFCIAVPLILLGVAGGPEGPKCWVITFIAVSVVAGAAFMIAAMVTCILLCFQGNTRQPRGSETENG